MTSTPEIFPSRNEVPETPTSPVLPVDPTTTVATTTEMSNEELEDYTADWKDFNNGLLEKEDSEEQWEQAASMENEADLEPGDLEALPEEYRDGQPEDADDYKDYYLHPKKASTGYASAVDEVTIPTTTTQKWSVSKEFAESHEYVNDDGSQEDGWMMVRRPAKSASSPLLSALSLAVLLLLN
uniref:SH3 domain-containing protein n=1 Tax=Steinernema glaseri TaxID=37863 RepID=A0A1I7YDX5_9BILA